LLLMTMMVMMVVMKKIYLSVWVLSRDGGEDVLVLEGRLLHVPAVGAGGVVVEEEDWRLVGAQSELHRRCARLRPRPTLVVRYYRELKKKNLVRFLLLCSSCFHKGRSKPAEIIQ